MIEAEKDRGYDRHLIVMRNIRNRLKVRVKKKFVSIFKRDSGLRN